jgi:hypothetical protein
MRWIIETINPRLILPVHTQKLACFEARWPERIVKHVSVAGRYELSC